MPLGSLRTNANDDRFILRAELRTGHGAAMRRKAILTAAITVMAVVWMTAAVLRPTTTRRIRDRARVLLLLQQQIYLFLFLYDVFFLFQQILLPRFCDVLDWYIVH